MDIRQLNYFVTVVNEGTITAAAKALHMSQPPLSTQIQLLEKEFGVPLFDRGTRQIRLTEAGRTFYLRACSILDLCASVKNEMEDIQAGAGGTMRLGIASSLCGFVTARWLRPFCRSHANIRIQIYEDDTYHLLEKVRTNQAELAFVRTPFAAADLNIVRLRRESLYAVGLPCFFQVGTDDPAEAVSLEDLAKMPLILYRRWEQILADTFTKSGLKPNFFCVNDDARTTLHMAESGLGVGIVPHSTLLRTDSLTARQIHCQDLQSDICVVCRNDTYISQAARHFLKWTQKDGE